MEVLGRSQRSIWVEDQDPGAVCVVDQRHLPHRFVVEKLRTVEETAKAVEEMHVRGAPLIGITAAYGMYLALRAIPSEEKIAADLEHAYQRLLKTRPTAVNLKWALEEQKKKIERGKTLEEKIRLAFENAGRLADEDAENCRRIGEFGIEIIREIYRKKKATINILTHCNAGWLACVDWGTQTAPIYLAFEKKIPVHVWVDETRPRNQGANLTAWELGQHGVPHTVIVDNVGGHLMQHGKVDLVLVGSDRTTRKGDVANKIGTYLKALAAKEHAIPFYVCLPSSTLDWTLEDGVRDIPIEERSEEEVKYMQGLSGDKVEKILITPKESRALNVGFDVTPAKFVTGLITERGICRADETDILRLFPERKKQIR